MRRDELKQKALEQFTDYFVKNYPGPDTIIYDPKWHAPKIFNAAFHAISAALSIEQTQPVAWYVKDYADGWVHFDNEADAIRERDATGAMMHVAFPAYAHPPVSALVNAQADADVVEIPAEPTDEMIEAGEEEIASRRSLGCRIYAADVWAAMVASLRPAEVGSATVSSGTGGEL